METLKNDIFYALGRFSNEPLATFVIILTLALGIGATSAIFSVVNGVLLNAAPFNNADRLVSLRQFQSSTEDSRMGFSAKDIADYREQASSLDEVAEYHNMTFTMYGHGEPKRVNTGVVSANFFPMLGLSAIHGRLFNPGEDAMGAEPLILLTFEYWQSEFKADPSIIGETVELNNRAHEIIGVLPAFPQFPNVNDVYMALPSCPWRSGTTALEGRSTRFLAGFGKTNADIPLSQAQAQLATIADRLSTSYPEDYPESGEFKASAISLVDELVQGSRSYLFILLGTTILVLLISCANVTNLILSQHARRQREFAVRSSLGATRLMLGKQLLTESILLALFAGTLGLCFAYFGLDLLQGFAEHFTSRANQIRIDIDVMVFTIVISLATGIAAGILPSLAKPNLVTALKEGGKSSYSTEGGPIRNALLVSQFGLSLILLVSAALSIKSLDEIKKVDPGYSGTQVQALQLDLNWTTYNSAESQWQVTQTIMDEVKALGYVDKVAASVTYPMDSVMSAFGQIRQVVQFDDRAFDANERLDNTYGRGISPDYFDLLGINILHGRDFSRHDTADDPRVIIINQSLATQYWPNESALEHKISFDNGQNWYTIIGVASDVVEQSLTSATNNQFYRPLAQFPSLHVAILASVATDQETYVKDIKTIIGRIDSQQAISKIESLEQALENSVSLQTFIAQVLTIFAGIAMFITVSGISGVLGYLVSVRTREIGIRMAVGATQQDVLLMILLYGLKLSIVGLSIGVIGAWWMADLLNEHLFNVASTEVTIYVVCLSIMLVVTIFASLLPSYRASRMDPNQALRAS